MEDERKEKIKGMLQQLLLADDAIRVQYLNDELSKEKASEFEGRVSLAIDGIILESMRSKELAESIVPLLAEKIEEGFGNPLPYVHLLQLLAFRHRIDIDGVSSNPRDIPESISILQKSELDLENLSRRDLKIETEKQNICSASRLLFNCFYFFYWPYDDRRHPGRLCPSPPATGRWERSIVLPVGRELCAPL